MNRLPSRRPFPLPYSKLKLATMHIKTFLLQAMKHCRDGKATLNFLFFFFSFFLIFAYFLFYFGMMYFCKLPKTTGSHVAGTKGLEVERLRGWVQAQSLQMLRGMKYMHNAKRDQQADKLTTPQPWHRWHLDTYQRSVCRYFFNSFFLYSGDMGRQDWCEGVFTPGSSGQLSLIWDLQVTLCPHGCLLTGARFMEWDSEVFSLWLAGLQAAMHKVL